MTYDFDGKPLKFHSAKIGSNSGVDRFINPDLSVGVAKTKNFADLEMKAKLSRK
jgi:hypothetical protein